MDLKVQITLVSKMPLKFDCSEICLCANALLQKITSSNLGKKKLNWKICAKYVVL